MAGGKKILFKRGGDCRNEWLFFRLGQILLFGRDQQTRAALDEVYKPKRRIFPKTCSNLPQMQYGCSKDMLS
uniref:Uncharacterized protein n=1 Tax=Rhodnius prolixus TaxID=13249 RepID=T1HZ02_RHOPR